MNDGNPLYSLKNLTDDLKIKFIRDQLELLMQSETSPFAQVFIQQHIIMYEMANVVYKTRYLVTSASKLEDYRKWAEIAKSIKYETVEELINKHTLGTLFPIFSKVLPKANEKDEMDVIIEDYITKRNNLTHKMTTRFNNIGDIQSVAVECRMLGDKVLRFFIIYGDFINNATQQVTKQRIEQLVKKVIAETDAV